MTDRQKQRDTGRERQRQRAERGGMEERIKGKEGGRKEATSVSIVPSRAHPQ